MHTGRHGAFVLHIERMNPDQRQALASYTVDRITGRVDLVAVLASMTLEPFVAATSCGCTEDEVISWVAEVVAMRGRYSARVL